MKRSDEPILSFLLNSDRWLKGIVVLGLLGCAVMSIAHNDMGTRASGEVRSQHANRGPQAIREPRTTPTDPAPSANAVASVADVSTPDQPAPNQPTKPEVDDSFSWLDLFAARPLSIVWGRDDWHRYFTLATTWGSAGHQGSFSLLTPWRRHSSSRTVKPLTPPALPSDLAEKPTSYLATLYQAPAQTDSISGLPARPRSGESVSLSVPVSSSGGASSASDGNLFSLDTSGLSTGVPAASAADGSPLTIVGLGVGSGYVATPEPDTAVLVMLAIVPMLACRRRRSHLTSSCR